MCYSMYDFLEFPIVHSDSSKFIYWKKIDGHSHIEDISALRSDPPRVGNMRYPHFLMIE